MLDTLLNNRYQIESDLGKGGMGTVYRARDTLLERVVAVKVLAGKNLSEQGRAHLLNEARSAARLNHPNIVTVYDVGEHADSPYIVMEYVQGESLYNQKPETEAEIVAIALQITHALIHAHAHDIIHRDLKPENVLLTREGTAKLTDFGLARSALAPRASSDGTITGTVFYLAPEQALGQTVDERTDLYALGVMLYELVTGRLPFIGEDPLTVISQHLHAPITPPREHKANINPSLEAVILKLLAKDPADRFTSAQDLARVLDQVLDGEASIIQEAISQPTFQKPHHNLPVQLNKFIGREKEIEKVRELLADSRLVTITGTGGSGKTRLALQVAKGMLIKPGFKDGVWLIELASLSDPSLVPQVIAAALNVREQPNRDPVDILSDYLRSRRILLILDNCEHLIDTCAVLVETLLRLCPTLCILVTSREPLEIAGETVFPLPTLTTPERIHGFQDGDSSEEEFISGLTRYEAVQLFVDRAASVQPGFKLDIDNANDVAQICHRLDGIPLAIELAAARLRALTVKQIASRLDDRLNLLTVGSRTALPRHQTLRATIDWSHDLLTKAERVAFRRLSVFVDGWTLEGAEAVISLQNGEDTLDIAQVLDLLTQLVNKSLVITKQERGGLRYRFLTTIRHYAKEKLVNAGEHPLLKERHLSYFLKLAEKAEPKLREEKQIIWADRLEQEHDNLRAALDWSLTHGESQIQGLRLASDLARFWYLRGYWFEGCEWLKRAISAANPVTDNEFLARAKALAGLAWMEDESGPERAYYEESLELSRKIGADWQVAFALRGLGTRSHYDGDYMRAEELLIESLALFQDLNDPWGMGLTRFNQGWLSMDQGNSNRAEELWETALSLFQQSGDRWGKAVVLAALGYLARLHGEYEYAMKMSKESLSLFKEVGDKAGVATSISRLGSVAFRKDEFEHALGLYQESLDLLKDLGYSRDVAHHTGIIGFINGLQGKYETANSKLQESLDLWRPTGSEWGIAWVTEQLGMIAFYQGDIQKAASLLEESLAMLREKGDKSDIAATKGNLGQLAYHQKRYDNAKDLLEESVALFMESDDRLSASTYLNDLGRVLISQQHLSGAAELLEAALDTHIALGSKRGIAGSLEGLAFLASARAETARALRLFSAADALRTEIGLPLPPIERKIHTQTLKTLRTELGEDKSDRIWKDGQKMSLEESISFAREGIDR